MAIPLADMSLLKGTLNWRAMAQACRRPSRCIPRRSRRRRRGRGGSGAGVDSDTESPRASPSARRPCRPLRDHEPTSRIQLVVGDDRVFRAERFRRDAEALGDLGKSVTAWTLYCSPFEGSRRSGAGGAWRAGASLSGSATGVAGTRAAVSRGALHRRLDLLMGRTDLHRARGRGLVDHLEREKSRPRRSRAGGSPPRKSGSALRRGCRDTNPAPR